MLVILIISVAVLTIAIFQLRIKLRNTDRYLGSRIIEFAEKFNKTSHLFCSLKYLFLLCVIFT